ncbi:hypothetical protein COT52_00435 [candidate division WWE3 bacterium CG08_land_8_20_14_0_20_43_13]|uniref:Type II secretion system protein n=1 Tax=candidate division WWE3 bacterium CG08_land_8_20_14_0_20_43_13 TaxID=1975087 RepID=A0A2H0X8B2_UNCKA|nr:MAG: hypothetical protein COT52_00435 [candidate division WWE3 bacterium CG08_land_8_20_14_0_20_43_13]
MLISKLCPKLKDSSGQSLIEVLIGVAVAMVVVSALVGLGITSLRQSTLNKNKQLALSLANSIAEQLRLYRDSNSVTDFPDSASGNCLSYDGSNVVLCGSFLDYPGSTVFDYMVSSEPLPAGVALSSRLLMIQVRFAISSGYETISIYSLLSNWNEL